MNPRWGHLLVRPVAPVSLQLLFPSCSGACVRACENGGCGCDKTEDRGGPLDRAQGLVLLSFSLSLSLSPSPSHTMPASTIANPWREEKGGEKGLGDMEKATGKRVTRDCPATRWIPPNALTCAVSTLHVNAPIV